MVRGPEGPDFEELHETVAMNFDNLAEYLTKIDIVMLTDVLKQTEGTSENAEERALMAVVDQPQTILTSSGSLSLEPGQTIKIIRK